MIPPLLTHLRMDYASEDSSRIGSEKTTGLTFPATSSGFVVAYADHAELSLSSAVDLGTIPELIAKKWCIDGKRIFLTGHSDGGTAAMALAFMTETRNMPRAIAPQRSWNFASGLI